MASGSSTEKGLLPIGGGDSRLKRRKTVEKEGGVEKGKLSIRRQIGWWGRNLELGGMKGE